MTFPGHSPVYALPESIDTLSQAELRSAAESALQYGVVLFEKCDLSQSKIVTLQALELARRAQDQGILVDVLSRLLRLAAEALDSTGIERWTAELNAIELEAGSDQGVKVLYSKSVVQAYRGDFTGSLRILKRALRISRQALRKDPSRANLELHVKILYSIAASFDDIDQSERAEKLARAILRKYESQKLKLINGSCYVVLGSASLRRKDLLTARKYFESAHSAFLEERNWFAHLYVLYRYAQLFRVQQDFTQAYWYLNLMQQALTGEGFEAIQRTIQDEKDRLEQAAVDLLIDSRACEISTRELQKVSLGKQYVLLGILEALTEAHGKNLPDSERGLSKAEIIRAVWDEEYRAEAHDNKLYYNINRLRKLIEPDVRHPKYLLNWKEGYRLAPGLKVQYVGGLEFKKGGVQ